MTNPRLSHQALRVLRLFLETPDAAFAGSDLTKKIGLLPGTIYPILARLAQARWLVSTWERIDPSNAGRPQKCLYRLTALGRRKASAAFAELRIAP